MFNNPFQFFKSLFHNRTLHRIIINKNTTSCNDQWPESDLPFSDTHGTLTRVHRWVGSIDGE